MAGSPTVNFFYEGTSYRLRQAKRLRRFIPRVFTAEGRNALVINYVFTTDNYLLRLNKTYLKHDYYTDILTFDLSETPPSVSGDVYISVERAKENARLTEGFHVELLRLMIHGALHLCGYRDDSSRNSRKMREKENTYITMFKKSFT